PSVTGEELEKVLIPSLPARSATLRRQSSLPVLRLKASATQVLAASSVEATKMRSPQTTGVAPLGPGIGLDQTTPSVLVKADGRFFSLAAPSKFGPRHWGQSPADERIRPMERRMRESHG